MSEFLSLFFCLGSVGVSMLLIVALLGAISTTKPKAPLNLKQKRAQTDTKASVTEAKGELGMLPQHLMEQISKVIEDKTGVKIPQPRSIEEILANVPKKDRAKLLPTLIPIVVDAIKESTGMNLDAALRLQEFLLGRGLGLTELDVAIEADALKLEKTLAARKRYKDIVDHFRKELGDDPAVDFVEKMYLLKLLNESFKDMPLPPGWSPQQAAGLLRSRSSNNDHEPLQGEVVE